MGLDDGHPKAVDHDWNMPHDMRKGGTEGCPPNCPALLAETAEIGEPIRAADGTWDTATGLQPPAAATETAIRELQRGPFQDPPRHLLRRLWHGFTYHTGQVWDAVRIVTAAAWDYRPHKHRHFYRPIYSWTQPTSAVQFGGKREETVVIYCCYCSGADQHLYQIFPGRLTVADITPHDFPGMMISVAAARAAMEAEEGSWPDASRRAHP
jgi:hypothetical protein